jgi:hypothetical protein
MRTPSRRLLAALFALLVLGMGPSLTDVAADPAAVTVRAVGSSGQPVLRLTQVTTNETPVFKDGDPQHACGGTSAAGVAGTINPEGLETSYELDLGIDTTYGTSIYGEAGSGSTPTEVTVGLQNLAPASTYHYRMVAINSDGRAYGSDRTFTTPAYNNPITQPLTLPLIASPAIAFPTETANSGTGPAKPLTNKQRLAKALNACHKKRNQSKRKACEHAAKKKYGPGRKKK